MGNKVGKYKDNMVNVSRSCGGGCGTCITFLGPTLSPFLNSVFPNPHSVKSNFSYNFRSGSAGFKLFCHT